MFSLDPIDDTIHLLETSRALRAALVHQRQSLRETLVATQLAISRSEELIRRADRTIATWGTLAAPPPRIHEVIRMGGLRPGFA
jgi:hypothetical protein